MDGATGGGRSDRGLAPRGRRSWLAILVLAAWLVGWGLGEWKVIEQLFFSDELPGGAWFLGLWLVLWTAGGLVALRQILRALAGKELPPPPPGPPYPQDPG